MNEQWMNGCPECNTNCRKKIKNKGHEEKLFPLKFLTADFAHTENRSVILGRLQPHVGVENSRGRGGENEEKEERKKKEMTMMMKMIMVMMMMMMMMMTKR